MFTPPPSPIPVPNRSSSPSPSQKANAASGHHVKRTIGRRTRWIAILGPLVLGLITLSTRYITHPAIFDVFDTKMDANVLGSTALDWSPHERHVPPPLHRRDTTGDSTSATSTSASTSGSSSSTGTTTTPTTTLAGTAQPVPTVPTTAVVPTPFPQPWDSGIQQNFSSASCFNFFSNMSNTETFRACRPFSLLLQSSTALVNAQNNLTLLNSIIWGTCNTKYDFSQCSTTMATYASNLNVQCARDLADNNANVQNALIGLKAYNLMHDAGCLADPTTNTYCYVNAVHNSNPSDVYMYQIALGLRFPNSSTPTCSSCTRSLMALYASGLTNATASVNLATLASNYPGAQRLADASCGANYAKNLGNQGFTDSRPHSALSLVVAAFVVVVVSMSSLLDTWSS